MQTFSQTILLGRLGDDPELKSTRNGTSYCQFSLATDRPVKDRNDEWTKETEWHRCIVWGRTAEFLCQHASKGSTVHVVGDNRTSKYEKEGVTMYATQVHVNTLSLQYDSNTKSDTPAPRAATARPQQPAAAASEPASLDFDDEDLDSNLPF